MTHRIRSHGLALALLISATSRADAFVAIDWVTVASPNNACEVQGSECYGAVGYIYEISKYEITNAQYAEFLDAVAADDPYALYNAMMGTHPDSGIVRSGSPGTYSYAVVTGRGNRPVVLVSFWDAVRFANWLNNGQGSASTESGSYTLLGVNPPFVGRNPGGYVFLTSEDEWYKAAYYDPFSSGYFDYPAGTDVQTVCDDPTPAPNRANCGLPIAAADVFDVGSYPNSASPWGTFDQGGNAAEWNDFDSGGNRRVRGGDYFNAVTLLAAATSSSNPPQLENANRGFRVSRRLPASVPTMGWLGGFAVGASLLLWGAASLRTRARGARSA